MRRWWAVAFCLSAAALGWPALPAGAQGKPAAPAKPEVDVALVLAVDISYSMDLEELALQRDGYIQAIRSRLVKDAIAKGAVGRIALTYVEWAASGTQYVIVPWSIIDSPAAADAFTEKLAEAPTRRGRRTSVSGAIDLGVKLLEDSGVAALKRVIDISGDGPNNDGRPVTQARADALAKGVVINGLPILAKPAGYFDIPDLDIYYEDCVIGGPGSFSISIRDQKQFAEAIRNKLVLELALGAWPPLPPGGPAVMPAQARNPRISCMVGERQWRDRMGN